MNHVLENKTLTISDPRFGSTKAVRAAMQKTPTGVHYTLECEPVAMGGGETKPLFISLHDKPALKAAVADWVRANEVRHHSAHELQCLSEANSTGNRVLVETYTQLRRYRDCGSSVEGLCNIERYALPNGEFSEAVKPCH